MAEQIRETVGSMEGVAILTVVEKALQLTQVAATELGLDAVAVAYNRVKPHMEAERRPIIQMGADSITSGGKFLAVYERDLNLLAEARGVILIDDVVSTGGTILGMADLLHEAARQKGTEPPEILGIFCAAREGEAHPLLPAPLHSLATLPKPVCPVP
jgi:adenine phosphoribosyltransferase